MCTASDPFRSKIGMTTGNPLVRFSQLRCGDPYLALYAAFLVPKWFGNIREVEANIHDMFSQHRLPFSYANSYSEWFNLRPASVIDALCDYFDEIGEVKWAMRRLSRLTESTDKEHIMLVGNDQVAFLPPTLQKNGRIIVDNRNISADLELALPEQDD